MIRVFLVDDHAIVREGIRALFIGRPDITVAGEAGTAEEAAASLMKSPADVVLLDMRLPGASGVDAIKVIRKADPRAKVIVLTTFLEDGLVREALKAGANGFLMKDVGRSHLLDAIRRAAIGEPVLHDEAQRQLVEDLVQERTPSPFQSLTERELDVLREIARGRSNKEIGSELGLTEGTVKGYVSSLLRKLNLQDRTQAALLAVKHEI